MTTTITSSYLTSSNYPNTQEKKHKSCTDRHFSEPNNHSFIATIEKKPPSIQLRLARSGNKSSQKSSRNTISNLAHEVFITQREHQQFGRSQNSLPTTQAIFNHNICSLWRKPPHPQHILTNYSICLVKSHLSLEQLNWKQRRTCHHRTRKSSVFRDKRV